MRRAIVILMLFMLSGCVDWLSNTDERGFGAAMIEATREGNFGRVDAAATPELRKQLTPELFDKVSAMVPPGTPELKGVNVQTNDGVTIKTLTYEVGEGKRWALVQVTLQPVPKGLALVGIYVQPMAGPLQSGNASAVAWSATNYIWVLAMVLAVAVSITGLVSVLRTTGLKLKWLWAIGCLISVVQFQNLVGGTAYAIFPFSILLLGAGGFKTAAFAPWVLQFAIPVPAIVFLIRKRMGLFDRDPLEGGEAEVFS